MLSWLCELLPLFIIRLLKKKCEIITFTIPFTYTTLDGKEIKSNHVFKFFTIRKDVLIRY